MPGNEVGDRVHNFFEQDNLSQSQHHSQVVEGNWPALSNNIWVGSQRQVGAPLISGTKNHNVQQSDSERGVAHQSMRVPQGLNFTQSTLRHELAKTQSQNQQSTLNGYVHGSHALQARQSETNFLGVDREPDRLNLASRGLYSSEQQQRIGPEFLKNASMNLEAAESPVNFDFLGGPHQMNNQQQGMMQSLPRQQSGFSDTQLLQQQAMFSQMQEVQRQQQIRQQDVRQQSLSHLSSMAKQAGGNHSLALVNGTSIHDGSNYTWTPELMAGNTNWLQCGAFPVMQGSSNGLMFSPDGGQVSRMMGMAPQADDQSLYGFPISSARGTLTPYSNNHTDKPTTQHISTCSDPVSGTHYAVPDQVSMQEGTLVSGQGFHGKNWFGDVPGQNLDSGVTENLQQANSQQRNASMQEFQGRQEIADSSESLHEKTVMLDTPMQSAAPLDPTEEKILFGTDDNIWEAFGRNSNIGSGGYNISDGSEFQNAFPSLHSGSWSALMQSAVAETSSGDIRLQDEWSGLTFPNSEFPTGSHQPSAFNDSGKQQTVWADKNLQAENNVQPVTSFVSRPFLLSDDVNASYCSIPSFQQSGINSFDKSERSLPHFSGRSQQSSEEGSKQKDHSHYQKPLTEGIQINGIAVHSSDAGLKAKSIPGSWPHQQNISSYSGGGQPSNKLNGWNFMGTTLPSGDASLKLSEKGNSLQCSQSSEDKKVVHEERGHSSASWKTNSIHNTTVGSDHVKPDMGTSPVNREDFNLKSVAATPNSSSTMGDQNSGQQFSNNRQLEYWKHIDHSSSKGGNLGSYPHNLNKNPQVLESSVASSDKVVVEMHGSDKCSAKEDSSDSGRNRLSHQAPSGGLKENVWIDASEMRTLPGGRQKSSGQIARKSSGSRKFQYHPMGNLDEDVENYYGTKLGTLSQASSQLGSRGSNSENQGSSVQSKFDGHTRSNSLGMEKGELLESQGDVKGINEVPSRSNFQGSVPSTSAPCEKPIAIYPPSNSVQSSKNMLELLHKVDQSREGGSTTHESSDCDVSSERPEGDTSDRSANYFQLNQSSSSQGFGLQLAPPSQISPTRNHALSFQSNSSLSQGTPETGDRGRRWLAPTGSLQFLPPSGETSQGQFSNNRYGISGKMGNEGSAQGVQGNFSASFTSGFPHSRSHLQNQDMAGSNGQMTTNQPVNMPNTLASRYKYESGDTALSGPSAPGSFLNTAGSTQHIKQASPADTSGTNQSHARVPTQKNPVVHAKPVSEPSVLSGMSHHGTVSTMLPTTWTAVSIQQRSLGAQPRNAPSSSFNSHLQSNNNVEKTCSAPQKGGDQEVQREGNSPSDSGACSLNSQGFAPGESTKESSWRQIPSENIDSVQKATRESPLKESIARQHSNAFHSNAAATQRDIEAFGRSLNPDSKLHQNYSLLHQMQAMKSMENDPNNRDLKRFKGPDCAPIAPRSTQKSYGVNNVVDDASINCTPTLLQFGDPKKLSFSSEPGDNRDKSQLGNIPPQDVFAFGPNGSKNFSSSDNTACGRSEPSQISPQMAPSWFDQYGTFKNGQIFPLFDAHKAATLKSMEQPYIMGKSSDGLYTNSNSQTEQANVAAESSQVFGQSSTPVSVATDHFSSSLSLPLAVTDKNFVVARPKKRRSSTSGLLPWHKEVMQSSQRPLNISMAEIAWAQSVNRLVEKVEDESLTEDGLLMLRPRRRLILTTQLMQQLVRPPPASVFGADASLNYERVAYVITRLVLGDACSHISLSSSNNTSSVPHDLLPENLKISEGASDEYYGKVVEDFIGRAKKLEADFLRLDKNPSMVDLRVDGQELEKFSVINRFAKFHGRGQADGAESSSSSDASTTGQKIIPQRYVTALPLPRNLPERVQCLSL